MVIGGDVCSKGRGFESQHCLLEGHFSHLFAAKIVICVCKDKNKLKRCRGWPILLNFLSIFPQTLQKISRDKRFLKVERAIFFAKSEKGFEHKFFEIVQKTAQKLSLSNQRRCKKLTHEIIEILFQNSKLARPCFCSCGFWFHHKTGKSIAQWILPCLPSCRPRFKSQAHHLCFYHLESNLCYVCHVKRMKINKTWPGWAHFF